MNDTLSLETFQGSTVLEGDVRAGSQPDMRRGLGTLAGLQLDTCLYSKDSMSTVLVGCGEGGRGSIPDLPELAGSNLELTLTLPQRPLYAR